MEYKIIGQTVPAVEMTLRQGEVVYTQSGGMTYQTEGIQMKTNARGGVFKSLGRAFSGESIFMAHYSAETDGAKIAFSATIPGSIVPVNMTGLPDGLIIQKGSFLCAENTVSTQVTFTKKFSSGLFGGEGFILQKATGTGLLFLEVDGDMITMTLQPGETIKVDTGNVVAWENSVSYQIENVKGLGNIFLGGEGLFLTRLVGPGKVILQTQNFGDFVGRIVPFLPSKN